MRLQHAGSSSTAREIKEFAYWLLQVGDGTVKTVDEDDSIIEIPSDLLVGESDKPLLDLVNFAYPDVVANLENHAYFEQRALLAPSLESVEEVNNFMISDDDSEIDAEWFTTEFLNDVKCFGLPNHRIVLKVGVPIMLIRNLDQSAGLCNGTRLMVTDLTPYIIVATALSGSKSGKPVYIPRLSLKV
ncbi:uncharacterized protein LOC130744352 [Lotus japonicus]|uniref:uncharacterized protein LOC130744352 n=1 Tax=Lotus japonicus TaxID=34305 RepID=UPI00258585C9|nr:uncharacterized protein LOC130744352 [Lotus japonicus]